MKLTDQMKEALRVGSPSGVVTYLVTSSVNGKCNIYLQPYTDVYKDEFIFSPDLFAQKSKININENRVAVMTVTNPATGCSWAFRGPCNIIQWGHPPKFSFHGVLAGEVLEKWGDWGKLEPYDSVDEDIRPKAVGQRGVFVLKVEEVYSVDPKDSGKKIL
ncbi:MAG: pyridoxamine 5'-phosphate oxidase [Nitrospinota bacterium]|nr:pyridoxamine 5'-phosphate oxidase [Nitrospinota bacterium]